jgi:hypothetical protein
MYSCLSAEERVPADHALRVIRETTHRILRIVDFVFQSLLGRVRSRRRDCASAVVYSIGRERMREQLNSNLLFRGFVGRSLDDAVGDGPGVPPKSRLAFERRGG